MTQLPSVLYRLGSSTGPSLKHRFNPSDPHPFALFDSPPVWGEFVWKIDLQKTPLPHSMSLSQRTDEYGYDCWFLEWTLNDTRSKYRDTLSQLALEFSPVQRTCWRPLSESIPSIPSQDYLYSVLDLPWVVDLNDVLLFVRFLRIALSRNITLYDWYPWEPRHLLPHPSCAPLVFCALCATAIIYYRDVEEDRIDRLRDAAENNNSTEDFYAVDTDEYDKTSDLGSRTSCVLNYFRVCPWQSGEVRLASLRAHMKKPISVPTIPVSVPTTPVSVPTIPVSVPTIPVSAPTTPVSVPTIPVSVPTIPVSAPTTLVSVPTIPVSAPTIPVSVPTIPVSVPTIPVSAPTIRRVGLSFVSFLAGAALLCIYKMVKQF